ncbi:hypothetical protein GGR52DRAFT_525501 [Hypoxylon sp. FL1284]|nr:hypothetical protein GGR52DRAFT_525501 [Hypoxylon sp. FL1284]
MAAGRDTYNRLSLGPLLNAHVKKARVLMVGAGGIGCELLKNLALSGFGEIHIVDLDTIDLSNLNRQFLFRHEHIKKSKALVAKEAAEKFNPNVKIVAHHANIKDAQFHVSWFKSFQLVFNALDNLEARRHVNRMCLAADVPLIESGTTGFNGQVQVIKRGVTACYDCTAKETPKTFPVCTIRSTPSQPIHCIVWGKSYLLNEIFGTSEDQASLDVTEDQENASEIAELKTEAEALRKIRESVGTEQFPQILFDKVFNTDVTRLRSMKDMWKSRNPPTPLEYKSLKDKATDMFASKDEVVKDGQRIWSLEENLVVFYDSLDRLSKRMLNLIAARSEGMPPPTISFDKDDDDTLDFVAASANLRSHVFGIEAKSRFDIKQMAGNIIPAIATTNAIVAGLSVLESYKVLRGEYNKAREVFLTPFAPQRLLGTDQSRPPNPECLVCGIYYTSLEVDLARAKLNDLVEDFVKLQLGYGEKEFAVNSDTGLVYDPDLTDNLDKTLGDLGIKQNSFVTIVDEDDEDTFVNVVVNIQEAKLSEKPIKGLGDGQAPTIPRKPKALPILSNGIDGKQEADGEPRSNGKHSADGEARSNDKKRKLEDVERPPSKKTKPADDEVFVIDDDAGTGAIEILD